MASKQVNTYRNAKTAQNESPNILKHVQGATGWPISKQTHSETQKLCPMNHKTRLKIHREQQHGQ